MEKYKRKEIQFWPDKMKICTPKRGGQNFWYRMKDKYIEYIKSFLQVIKKNNYPLGKKNGEQTLISFPHKKYKWPNFFKHSASIVWKYAK